MEIADRISELKETKTWKLLKSLSSAYAEASVKFLEHITPILHEIQIIFPFYTRHDAKHGYQVLRRIEEIVIDQCLKKNSSVTFTAAELLLLICASYGHDLGMSVFPGEKTELLSQLNIDDNIHWKVSPILQKYLREHHSQRGGLYIDKHADQFQFPHNLIFPLHQLMSSHNWSIQQLENEFINRTAADYQEIDLRQLSCILCIADAIEFSDSRVIDGVLDQLSNKVDEASILSYRENMKHFCIQNSVAVGKDGKIIFSGTFQDPEILNIAHKTIDVIEDWLKNYCDIDYASTKKRLRVRSDSISRNLQSLQFDFERLGIRIKKENIINLISSHSTWSSNPSIAVRELLQNAVEACRYRKFNTNENFKPKITVYINKKDRTITVSDNGCGMSRHVVLNNLLTVGNSRSSEPSYKQTGYSPLARFGIGFWSTFILANQVDVETAPFEPYEKDPVSNAKTEGLKFSASIQEFKDYTVFVKTHQLPGTEIKLHLKPKIDIDNIFASISTLLTCSDIPIIFQLEETVIEVPMQILSRNVDQLFGPKANFLDTINIKSYQWKKSTDQYDMLIDLYYSNAKEISFLFWGNTLSVSGDIGAHQNPFSICGFKVGMGEAPSIFIGYSVSSYCFNYKDPSGFEYSLNRNTLEHNHKFTEVLEVIRDNLYDAYRNMLRHENAFTQKNIYRLNIESRRNRGGNDRHFTDDEFKVFEEKYSDVIAFELSRLILGAKYEEIEKVYKNLREIIEEDIEIWSVPKRMHFKLPYEISTSEAMISVIYSLVASINVSKTDVYFHPSGQEVTLLIDHCDNLIVDVIFIPFKSQEKHDKMPIVKFHTRNIGIVKQKTFVININAGKWSGTIILCELNGANYVIYDQSRALIKKDSELGNELFFLYQNAEIQKISKIIYLLLQAEAGFVDESIRKYTIYTNIRN